MAEDTVGCLTDTSKLQVFVSGVGIDQEREAGIIIYPNPAQGRFMIRAGDHQRLDGFRLKVTDQAGRVISETTLAGPLYEYTFPPGTGPGLYLVQLSDPFEGVTTTRKIVFR